MKQFILLLLFLCSSLSNAAIDWVVVGKSQNNQLITEIRHTLPKGWHTYWKNPGDSGDRARIFTKQAGIDLGQLQFPKPTIIPVDPLITYGYNDNVTYTLPINKLPSGTTQINASYSWLECKELCIPKEQEITLNLPLTTQAIRATTDTKTITTEIIKKGKRIFITLPKNTKNATFFPLKNNQINPLSQIVKNNQLIITLSDKTITELSGELYLNESSRAITINQTIQVMESKWVKLSIILLTAFLGGLILNIMPCVLPIIAIKALQLSQDTTPSTLKDSVSYWLGILSTMLIFYGFIIAIKLSGASIGWGFQLQSPGIIMGLIGLFLVITAINLDALRIPMPAFASKKTNNMMLHGALTTIIATPCTAPFLGGALSIALFQSTALGIAIFTMISIGLALPMSLLILNPNLRRFLPKSGQWNQRIKFSLTIGFTITIAWLAWVLFSQVSSLIFLTSVLCITAFFILLILKNRYQQVKLIIIGSLTIFGCCLPLISTNNKPSEWEPYTPSLIKKLEASNAPYFIDITAKWCITCQTNKLTVLNTSFGKKLFTENNIRLIQADWTNKNQEITNLLAKYEKVSIPVYIYYDGKSHNAIGDILTKEKLRRFINKTNSL